MIQEISSHLEKVGIKWIWKRYTKFPIILSTIYDLFITYIIARRLVKKERYDIVHCRSSADIVRQRRSHAYRI